jgi:hypothetical protein
LTRRLVAPLYHVHVRDDRALRRDDKSTSLTDDTAAVIQRLDYNDAL